MSTVSFLKCLTLMDLSLSMKDVSKMASQYDSWILESTPLMKKFGIYRDFMAVSAKFKKSRYEFTEGHGDELKAPLKAFIAKCVADNTIPNEEVTYLKKASLFLRADSPASWKYLSQNVVMLGDKQLAALFLDTGTKDVADMSNVQTLERIVFQLTKRKNDINLSIKEIREFKDTHPKSITKYSETMKLFRANYSKALLKFVRLSGKDLIDVVNAKSYLKAMGCDYLPTGFVGKVDEKGILYTSAGLKLHGRMSGPMKMNPSYNPKTDDTYYCSLLGGMRGELRTKALLAFNRKERHEKVADFASNINQHRNTWLKALDSTDTETRMVAAITELIHLTWARIGGEKNKNDGKQTFGISTLRVRQVRVTPQGLQVKYPGKKGTINTHSVKPTTPSNRKVINIVKSAVANKGREDKIWTVGGHAVTPVMVNKYLKSIGVSVTIHKFRHAAATRVAMDIVDTCKFTKKKNPGQKPVEAWLKEECLKIGTMLHHRTGSGDEQKVTSSTAIASYIAPEILRTFFVDLGLRVPDWIPEELDE